MWGQPPPAVRRAKLDTSFHTRYSLSGTDLILRILLPPRQHGNKIIPAMQNHHHQMSQDETQNRPHHREVPDPCIVKPSHHPRQPGKLDRLPYAQTSDHRKHSQPDRRGVSLFLQRVVGFAQRGLRPEKEIVLHHRPHSGNVAMSEQHLPVVAAEDLIAEIHQPGRNVDPHEGEMPLQRPAQPAPDGECLRPMQQIILRNLRPKTGEGAKNLQAASHHHEQRNHIDPVAQPHYKRMLVNRPRHHPDLVVFAFTTVVFHREFARDFTLPRVPATDGYGFSVRFCFGIGISLCSDPSLAHDLSSSFDAVVIRAMVLELWFSPNNFDHYTAHILPSARASAIPHNP